MDQYLAKMDGVDYYITLIENENWYNVGYNIRTLDYSVNDCSSVYRTKYSMVIEMNFRFIVLDLIKKEVVVIEWEFFHGQYVANEIYNNAIIDGHSPAN